MNVNKMISGAIAGLLLVSLILLVMSMQYHDEVTDHLEYCSNVEEGTWPDYNNNYEEVCK